ncbi:MAG: NADH-quinone oxidoreductase subunit H [Chitinophagaceae bacterium]|nr:NADH-quinone oxidoreductase subunit H [Chitinophagaceae bacterium]
MNDNYVSIDLGLVLEKLILIVVVTFFTLLAARLAWSADRRMGAIIRKSKQKKGISEETKPAVTRSFYPIEAPRSGILWLMTVMFTLVFTMLMSGLIPWGDGISVGGRKIALHIARIDPGILFIIGLFWIALLGIMGTMWNKGTKLDLLKNTSLYFVYSLTSGLSVVAILIISGSTDLRVIESVQRDHYWNVILQPAGIAVLIWSLIALFNRGYFPGDISDEYLPGPDFKSPVGIFRMAEYVVFFLVSSYIVTLYFGGYDIPFTDYVSMRESLGINVMAVLQVGILLFKTALLILFFLWLRWKSRRFTRDQLIEIGWKFIIPMVVINFLVTAIVVLVL